MSALHVCVAAFAALLPITNPIGAVAGFAGLTSSHEPTQAHREAVRTGIYVAIILATFALLGTLVLEAFGITIPSLQIAGGLVVAHAGFGMITARDTSTQAERDHAATKQDVSFSPMALPLVAGPGAIGVVIALVARQDSIEDRFAVVVASLLIGLLIGVTLRFGTPLVDRLGPTGVGALTRIMGFLILTIGVELIIHGVQALT